LLPETAFELASSLVHLPQQGSIYFKNKVTNVKRIGGDGDNRDNEDEHQVNMVAHVMRGTKTRDHRK
jgi:ABC-type hemin transport system ATPase subunit